MERSAVTVYSSISDIFVLNCLLYYCQNGIEFNQGHSVGNYMFVKE